ncbi:DUF4468 domain-containing protein [Mucilaginibacter xinganensis]|uniref:DUF4468 domain-containing protein n=1 Tax=Mucilaginibacter xinganensis TaxID=1234841 RepID=A0A223NZR0_9SPHI|nr:DUF4468 domain-containing protein [Mucilaginibacter xinganensis]ASU35061.1 hypothetical protein MuYL_3176 [Mucilaginibacter xinganensis]
MKKLIAVSVLVLLTTVAFAQKDSLAVDENNKYIYYQVVSQPGLPFDTLFNRALYFFKKAYPESALKLETVDKEKGMFTASGYLLVSKKTLLTSHEDGAVSFSMRVDVKDSKYRYWLSDFVFNPYQRNRFNTYESVPGIYIPLEKPERKIEKKDLLAYLDGVLTGSRKIGATLKQFMLKTSSLKKEVKLKKISTKDW